MAAALVIPEKYFDGRLNRSVKRKRLIKDVDIIEDGTEDEYEEGTQTGAESAPPAPAPHPTVNT